jgi:polar amino acid transport system permease protein
MDLQVLKELQTWTPYLLGGFAINIGIALLAMVVGTAFGGCLAVLRLSEKSGLVRAGLVLTELTRNVPTIVFQFYLVYMLPREFTLPGTDFTMGFPAWLSASLALAMAVIGFTSDNLVPAIRDWRSGKHTTALLFLPNWTGYMLIIVIASSTASIIGVSEIVSRCNTVINATGNAALMIPVYLYACGFFILLCYPLTRIMGWIHLKISRRYLPA